MLLLAALTSIGVDTTLESVEARHDRPVVTETRQTARVTPTDLGEALSRTPAAAEPATEGAFDRKYSGWSRDSLTAHSAKLRARYYELVEREADSYFDDGRYSTFFEGVDRRSTGDADRIRAVRKTRMGWYQEAVLEPEECPELYRVREEIAWLDAAMARDDRG